MLDLYYTKEIFIKWHSDKKIFILLIWFYPWVYLLLFVIIDKCRHKAARLIKFKKIRWFIWAILFISPQILTIQSCYQFYEARKYKGTSRRSNWEISDENQMNSGSIKDNDVGVYKDKKKVPSIKSRSNMASQIQMHMTLSQSQLDSPEIQVKKNISQLKKDKISDTSRISPDFVINLDQENIKYTKKRKNISSKKNKPGSQTTIDANYVQNQELENKSSLIILNQMKPKRLRDAPNKKFMRQETAKTIAGPNNSDESNSEDFENTMCEKKDSTTLKMHTEIEKDESIGKPVIYSDLQNKSFETYYKNNQSLVMSMHNETQEESYVESKENNTFYSKKMLTELAKQEALSEYADSAKIDNKNYIIQNKSEFFYDEQKNCDDEDKFKRKKEAEDSLQVYPKRSKKSKQKIHCSEFGTENTRNNYKSDGEKETSPKNGDNIIPDMDKYKNKKICKKTQSQFLNVDDNEININTETDIDQNPTLAASNNYTKQDFNENSIENPKETIKHSKSSQRSASKNINVQTTTNKILPANLHNLGPKINLINDEDFSREAHEINSRNSKIKHKSTNKNDYIKNEIVDDSDISSKCR